MKPFLNWVVPMLTLAAGFALGVFGRSSPGETANVPATETPKQVLYWYDPMVPDQHFDQPGKSPFMDMMLVPKYADDSGPGIAIDGATRQTLGVRIGEADVGPVGGTTTLSGELRFDPRQEVVVASRIEGTVVDLDTRLPWQPVVAGQRLMTIESPGIDAAVRDLLALTGARSDTVQALVGPARLRLQRLGMPASQVAAIEASGSVPRGLIVTAPRPGVLRAVDVRPGARVMPGEALVRIQGLDPMWLEVAVPEQQSAGLAPGTRVSFATAVFPGESFEATVFDAVPEVDPMTRTRMVRLHAPNPQHRFASGARVRVAWPGMTESVLRVPVEALIRTGERNVVIRERAGRFLPVEVDPGHEDGRFVAIESGLQAGDRIVLSGQFLIDSEANLQGALDRLGAAMPVPETEPAHAGHQHDEPPEHAP